MTTQAASTAPGVKTRNRITGALLGVIGLYAVIEGKAYGIGSLTDMGPGCFPAGVGALLIIAALIIGISATEPAREIGHDHKAPIRLRGPLCIILALIAFTIIGEYGGFLLATFAVVFISALGDRSNNFKTALFLAIALCAASTAIFWWGLKLQLPLLSWG